jgi:hypothetical protein
MNDLITESVELFHQVKDLQAKGEPIPEELLKRIRYVFAMIGYKSPV